MDFLGTVGSRFGGLAKDYLQAGPARSFFRAVPQADSLARRLEELKGFRFDRSRIRRLLESQNQSLGCGPETLKNLAVIEAPDTVFISCGHQACLWLGPLFTAYKILTTIRLAREARERFGITAIPLFWLATDDDDLAEVAQSRFPDGTEETFDFSGFKGSAGNLPSPLTRLPGGPALLAESWGEYHGRLLHSLFGKFGVVTIDPLRPETAELRKDFFEALLPAAGRVREKVLDTADNLKENGFRPQVAPRKDDTFLYLRDGLGRKRWNGEGRPAPALLLTSALSRLPSIEFSLPVAAEVSGPSEIAYHAETRPFYDALGRSMPLIVPRFSATLFRSEDLETLDKAGIPPAEALESPRAVMEEAAWEGLPLAARKSLDNLEEGFDRLFEPVRKAFVDMDPSLSGTVDASLRKAKSIRAYLEKKCRGAARRKLSRDDPGLGRTFDFICPGEPQERHFNFLYFCMNDPAFLSNLLERITPFDFNHALLSAD